MKPTRRYAIKNKNGEWFDGTYYIDRGLTKAGKPRKSGLGVQKNRFRAGAPVMFPKATFDYYIRTAVQTGRTDLFEDTEIVAFDYVEFKTTLKMETVRKRAEAQEIIRKLKE